VAGEVVGDDLVISTGAFLAGGCAGFLLHNWSPAKIFMGDVGSAFLGFVFGAMPLIAAHVTTNDAFVARLPFFAALTVWPFIADTFLTLCIRVANGDKVWRPHRSHLYQRLAQAGWSHGAVAFYYGIWSILCSAAGLFFLFGNVSFWCWESGGLFLAMTVLLTVRSERKNAAKDASKIKKCIVVRNC
jgi:UDP-N-acetylmuramyl pentapeptide phosphotransferase/UDP-N-acetylglucosamine-1-phosphate transferase